MRDYLKNQQVKEIFSNREYKAGNKFSKTEQRGETSTFEILSYLGKQFGTEEVYVVKANLSYFVGGQDSFSIKTGKEIKLMIEREKYNKLK